jgi:hypothetical protein
MFSCSTARMAQLGLLVMVLIFSFFELFFPNASMNTPEVAVGCVRFAQGSKVRLPAVEMLCIAAFIFLF